MNTLPRVETQRSDQVSDVSQQSSAGSLVVNNLVYKQPKALSLAVSRSYHRQYFQRSNYESNQTAIIDVNSGTQFIDPSNSYMVFKLAVDSGTCNFGSGSAMNIIREVTIRTRSGTELARLERANLYQKIQDRYTLPDSYLKKYGVIQGYGPLRSGADDDANISITPKTFMIPLSKLSGFFRPIKGQLIPPQLMSGLKMEIVFENAVTALYQKTVTPTKFLVTDLTLMLDSVEMTDDTQKAISFASAKDGLEYVFPRVHTAVTSHPSAQTTASIQIRKAVSQATTIETCVLTQANILDITEDSFKSVDWDVKSYSYRLGSLYFPNQTLIDNDKDGVEAYVHAQQTFDKLKHPFSESSISVTEFKTGDALICASFEKDAQLNLSGLPINNSRICELNMTFDTFTGAREIVTFLEYVGVSKTFVDNTSVAL